MTGKMNNIIRIPTSVNTTFFKYWIDFLKPFHSLTSRESQVAALFLKKRHELSKVIKDEVILDKVVLGEENKRFVRDECDLSVPHYQVIMSTLKKRNFIINERINPKFIPNITEEQGSFRLLLNFELGQ